MESNIPQTVEELHTQQMNEWNGGIEKKLHMDPREQFKDDLNLEVK